MAAIAAEPDLTKGRIDARPLRILAWRRASIESGGYDAVATPIAYPRPAVVDVRPID